MQNPPFIAAGSVNVPPVAQSSAFPLTLKVRGAAKFPQTRWPTLPTTSLHVAPVPSPPEFAFGATAVGLLQRPAHGPVPPPVVPAVPVPPAAPVAPPVAVAPPPPRL